MRSLTTIVILIALAFMASCSEDTESTVAEVRPLTVTVYASGTLHPANEYKVYAAQGGLVSKVYVQEGDTISENMPLLKIQSDRSSMNTEDARLSMELAQQNYVQGSPVLEELELQIRMARAKMETDSTNYSRYKTLHQNNVASDAELEQYELAYKTSRNQYIIARNRLASTETRLKTDLARAKNMYRMASTTESDFVINSLISGMVYAVYKKQGEMVMLQEPVALMGEKDEFVAELTIDELDISRIEEGQEVIINIDTYGKRAFHAVITKIYPMPDERTQAFKVDATFTEEMPKLYPGLSIEANVIIKEKEAILTIPLKYLKDDRYVINEDGDEIEIETGVQNNEFIEVVSGLEEGETILLPGK